VSKFCACVILFNCSYEATRGAKKDGGRKSETRLLLKVYAAEHT